MYVFLFLYCKLATEDYKSHLNMFKVLNFCTKCALFLSSPSFSCTRRALGPLGTVAKVREVGGGSNPPSQFESRMVNFGRSRNGRCTKFLSCYVLSFCCRVVLSCHSYRTVSEEGVGGQTPCLPLPGRLWQGSACPQNTTFGKNAHSRSRTPLRFLPSPPPCPD